MKLLSLALVTLFASAEAGVAKPEVLIGINVGDGQTGTLGGIEPKIKWSTSGVVAGCDVEGGIDVTITDVDEPPVTNVWAKLRKTISKFGDVSIRGDMEANNPDTVDLDVRATAYGTYLQVLGTAGTKAVTLSKVQVTKDISTLGGTLTLNPKYDLDSSTPDVRLGYAKDGTSFQLDAQAQKLTVAHSFNSKDTITPSVSMSGDVSLSYSRNLDRGKVTTTYSPHDSVKLQWSDGVYETTIKAPLDGYYKAGSGIKVNMKRTVVM